jgi:gamma-glutamylcyclotransferase (GGCT)/AIG2-like uncharacterized protein YtfP
MEEFSSYLFVYGTLLDDRNEFGAYLKDNCSFYKKAKFKGKLYDIGEYPGAVPDPHNGAFVFGSIFRMNNSETVLQRLDYYEGFGRDHQQPNEFIRALVEVETGDKPVKCWIYLYNLPVDDLWHIASGDYMEYIGI